MLPPPKHVHPNLINHPHKRPIWPEVIMGPYGLVSETFMPFHWLSMWKLICFDLIELKGKRQTWGCVYFSDSCREKQQSGSVCGFIERKKAIVCVSVWVDYIERQLWVWQLWPLIEMQTWTHCIALHCIELHTTLISIAILYIFRKRLVLLVAEEVVCGNIYVLAIATKWRKKSFV